MENMEILHPENHMFFNQGIKRHNPDVVGYIMNQLSLKEGLKIWGKKGRATIYSEMKKLHTRYTFLPQHWKNMSHYQKNQTLESHLFLN